METPGTLLRDARRRHGVSQKRLAIRAGTTQSAISRIEKDRVSPSFETLRELLWLVGEDLVLETQPRDWGVDVTLYQKNLEFAPNQRVERGLAFADTIRDVRREVSGRQAA
ncbi:MAG: helix-turn-helix domain-containing protein [Solirubrobacterales bacterium]